MTFARKAALTCLAFCFASVAYPQGRAAQPPAQPAAQPTPGGRGGRGGVPGPGPAIGGEVHETPAATKHTTQVNGQAPNYAATVAQMPLKDAAGETEARILHVDYSLDGADPAKRPVSF